MKNMKKIGAVFMAGALALSMATGAFAKGPERKDKEVVVTLEVKEIAEVVYEGETIDLVVKNQKKGSGYNVEWSVTGLNADGSKYDVSAYEEEAGDYTLVEVAYELITEEDSEFHVTEAEFTGYTPGTYEITATVTMRAGQSHVYFGGTDNVEQTVEQVIVLPGVDRFEARNIVAVASYNQRGNITGYNVTYDLYIIFEDKEEKLYQEEMSTTTGAGQKTANLNIDFGDENYKYTVTRP